NRARELCEQLGEQAVQMEALLLLGRFLMARREYDAARELAQRVLDLAEPAKVMAMVAGAHYLIGLILTFKGQFEASREHLELAIAIFGPGPFRNFAEASYAQGATAFLTTTLLFLGYPAAALKKSREFLDAVRQLDDPAALATAGAREALNHSLLRDSRRALERAEELLLLATEHGWRFRVALATFYRGCALADQGRGKEGLAEMSRVLPAFEGTVVATSHRAIL